MEKTQNVFPPRATRHAALSQYLPKPPRHFRVAQPNAVNDPYQRADVGQHRRVDDPRFIEDYPIEVQLDGLRQFGSEGLRCVFRKRRVCGACGLTRRWLRIDRSLAWRFANRRSRSAVTPGVQGVLFLFPTFRPAVCLDSFVRLLPAMTSCAAKGAPHIYPASVLRSRQKSNAAVKAVFDATLQRVIRLQEGVQRRLILPNKPIDLFAFVPIRPIREKLPDRDQKNTDSRLQCEFLLSHPRPTSSTLMRRVGGRGLFLRQHKDSDKNSLHTFLRTSLITSLPLRSLSQTTRSHSLKTTTWKKKTQHPPILFFQVVGHFN
jgi:hypothetical protein